MHVRPTSPFLTAVRGTEGAGSVLAPGGHRDRAGLYSAAPTFREPPSGVPVRSQGLTPYREIADGHRLRPRTSAFAAPSGVVNLARPTKEMVCVEDDAEDNELRDDGWNEQARDETPMQRLDRNWADLLQELRVVQTGVQLLTGFLLTLPFQARFEQLSAYERAVYLITVALSVAATGFLIAPVSLHRTAVSPARTGTHGHSVASSGDHRTCPVGCRDRRGGAADLRRGRRYRGRYRRGRRGVGPAGLALGRPAVDRPRRQRGPAPFRSLMAQ